MTTVLDGQRAPDFRLSGPNGQRFALSKALERGPVVAAFFKISCPVCQFTFPFLERLYRAYGGGRITFLGISQDSPRDTKEFCKEYGVTFPALSDEKGYPVSNTYGLTNVPTLFLIAPDGTVKASALGFDKSVLEKISSELARDLGRAPAPVFLPGEVVPDSKPG